SISIILLASYAAYVLFGIFGFQRLRRRPDEGHEEKVVKERRHRPAGSWPAWLSVAVLGLATAGLIPVTDILTGAVEPVTGTLGWTQVFVGMVIVANAGNVAEGYAAIRLAFQRGGEDPEVTDSGLDLSLGIASAS